MELIYNVKQETSWISQFRVEGVFSTPKNVTLIKERTLPISRTPEPVKLQGAWLGDEKNCQKFREQLPPI